MKGVAALVVLLLATGAEAGPWAAPGDARLRADVELLKAHGAIRGPTNAWPLPWATIDDGIARARAVGSVSPALDAAVARLEVLSERNRQRSRYEVRAAAATAPALVRGFAESARNRGDASAFASHDLGDLSVTWGGSWNSSGIDGQPATQRGNGFSLRPSQAALRLGNHALYGGYVDTHWGPMHDGALLFSASARAFPKVGLKRLRAETIDVPVLRWLGPVRWDLFVGILDEARDFRNTAIIGIRVEFAPAEGLEIGLNRGLQLCGEGRPCSLGTIARALIGVGNLDNTGTDNEPGNQLAGFDIAYSRPIGRDGHAVKMYFETVAEDEDNFLIEQFARSGGVRLMGPVGTSGATYVAGMEYTDTLASKFFGGQKYPGSMYNNSIYTDGWTYHRRPLGYSLDGDTKVLTVHGSLTDSRNRRWYGSARSIDLNVTPDGRYRISQTREKIAIVSAGVDWPTRIGDLRLEGRVQNNAPNTPDSDPTSVQAEVGWVTRF